ncbi:type I restriction enzyme HsdR N-terminal domain-containing protein [Candidatus Bipolaricaulota bacterium]|nr:type I restriction enzyme HsdR N-terminal domain-containing protein [Candidatus Bipolaricaulota bacterium]
MILARYCYKEAISRKQNWQDFIDKIQRTIENNPDLDEANTKSRIISPLLKKLGWEPLAGDVRAEYPIKFATRTSHVDYALMVEGSPAVFVEAKALRSDINPGHAKQLIDYGRHKGVNWCVLANGKELRVYNSAWLDPEDERTQEALVEALTVEEFVDNLDIIEKISKESITSGKTGQAFKRIKQTNDTTAQQANIKWRIVFES